MARFSHGIVMVLGLSEMEANRNASALIEPVHLLLGLCKFCDVPIQDMMGSAATEARQMLVTMEAEATELRQVFLKGGLDWTRFRQQLREEIGTGSDIESSESLHRSPQARKVFARGERLAQGDNGTMRPIHLFAALLECENPLWLSLMDKMKIKQENLAEAVRVERLVSDKEKQESQAEPTSILDKYGRDLTRLAAEGKLDPVIGRRQEMKTLAQALLQKRKNNAILVGEAGVGKTGIVEGLAQRIVSSKPPTGLKGKRVVEITMAALVAGTKYRGEFEERLQTLLEEIAADPDLVLFMDEIHTMMGAGGKGSSDAANILKPALARGELRCIGATTIAEYRQTIEKDAALQRRFQVVWVVEPTREEAIEILQGIRAKLEQHHGLTITDDAIQAAVELSLRYLTDFRLPDKAIDLIDQACAQVRLASLSQRSDLPAASTANEINRSDIARVVAQRCRIPVDRLAGDEAERLLQMENYLGQRVIGQDEAIRAVSATLRTARAGLKNPKRPMGVFLFLGSTGTGKTELAKALAEFLFDDEGRLLRFDMSEYMEEHSVSKLIGAPPGYVGYNEEGQLTGPVRTNPYSVILFDEIEKAHPRVLDLFLQIFDDGRLTDAQGRRASFTEAIIILTSNLGCRTDATPAAKRLDGFGRQEDESVRADHDAQAYRQQIMAAVRQALRPELINRIDELVVFQPLSEDVVRRIIDKILSGLRDRLQDRQIELNLAAPVYDTLLAEGYDPAYGAREMERVIERRIVQPLGQAILEGKFRDGDRVKVVVANDTIKLQRDGAVKK